MTLQDTKTMETSRRMNAHDWMRALRLEQFRVADLRRLRVGEQLWVAYFAGPGVTTDTNGHCEAYFERVRGGYRFAAVWTMQWSEKTTRAHVLTDGAFDLLPGNTIVFVDADVDAERAFRLVCRYAGFIDRHGEAYGLQRWRGAPYHCHALWRGMTVLKNGHTKHGVQGPEPRGLGAVVETAMALGIVSE